MTTATKHTLPFQDFEFSTEEFQKPCNMVLPPWAYATQVFIDHMQRPFSGRVLDLGTGSGILAMMAARDGADVVATDVDAEVILYAETAAKDNGIYDIDWRIGFDFHPIKSGEQFDRIVAHMPFMPSRYCGDDAPYADGGPNGWDTANRILAEAHEFLAPGGTLEMLGVWPVRTHPPQAAKLFTHVQVFAQPPEKQPDWGEYCFVRATKEKECLYRL